MVFFNLPKPVRIATGFIVIAITVQSYDTVRKKAQFTNVLN